MTFSAQYEFMYSISSSYNVNLSVGGRENAKCHQSKHVRGMRFT